MTMVGATCTVATRHEPTEDHDDKYIIRSVKRALSILSTIGTEDSAIGLSDIGRLTNIDKATTLRLLTTMENIGFVARADDGRGFGLGTQFIRLFTARHLELRRLARPHMERLACVTGEMVELIELCGTGCVRVDGIPSSHELGLTAPIGRWAPSRVAAGGKAILAFLPAPVAGMMAEEDDGKNRCCCSNSNKNHASILALIRDRGYAVSINSDIAGAILVAAPVFGGDGYPVAALSVGVPIDRLKCMDFSRLISMVRETASAISGQPVHTRGRCDRSHRG